MLKKSLIQFSLLVLLLPVAFPQGRGGGQGQGGSQGQGSGMGQGQGQGSGMGQGRDRVKARDRLGLKPGDTQRDQKRIHATTQQRNQIQNVRQNRRWPSQTGSHHVAGRRQKI